MLSPKNIDAEAPSKYFSNPPKTRKCDTVKHNRPKKSQSPPTNTRKPKLTHQAPVSLSLSLSLSLSQSPPLINLPTLLFRLIHDRRQKLLLIPRRRTRRQDIIFNTTRRQMIQHSMIRMNQHTTIILHRRRPIQNTLAQKPGQSRWRR